MHLHLLHLHLLNTQSVPHFFGKVEQFGTKKKYLVNVDKRKPFMTIVKILVKYVQDVVLNVGDLSSQGTSPHVWKHSDYCNSGLLLVSSRQRQGMLLDFIQYTGQPLKTKKYLITDVSSRRDPDLERQNIHQHNSFRFFFFFCKGTRSKSYEAILFSNELRMLTTKKEKKRSDTRLGNARVASLVTRRKIATTLHDGETELASACLPSILPVGLASSPHHQK